MFMKNAFCHLSIINFNLRMGYSNQFIEILNGKPNDITVKLLKDFIKQNIMVRGLIMKSYDDWKKFINTGNINDYLNYIACTQEKSMEEYDQFVHKDKEGGMNASINYCDGNGPIGNVNW